MQKFIYRTHFLDTGHSMYQAHSGSFKSRFLTVRIRVYWYVCRSRFIFYLIMFQFLRFLPHLFTNCKAQFQRDVITLLFYFILLFFINIQYILSPPKLQFPRGIFLHSLRTSYFKLL